MPVPQTFADESTGANAPFDDPTETGLAFSFDIEGD
jgi:hypothetical protein